MRKHLRIFVYPLATKCGRIQLAPYSVQTQLSDWMWNPQCGITIHYTPFGRDDEVRQSWVLGGVDLLLTGARLIPSSPERGCRDGLLHPHLHVLLAFTGSACLTFPACHRQEKMPRCAAAAGAENVQPGSCGMLSGPCRPEQAFAKVGGRLTLRRDSFWGASFVEQGCFPVAVFPQAAESRKLCKFCM